MPSNTSAIKGKRTIARTKEWKPRTVIVFGSSRRRCVLAFRRENYINVSIA
jgi:hypothetical protein